MALSSLSCGRSNAKLKLCSTATGTLGKQEQPREAGGHACALHIHRAGCQPTRSAAPIECCIFGSAPLPAVGRRHGGGAGWAVTIMRDAQFAAVSTLRNEGHPAPCTGREFSHRTRRPLMRGGVVLAGWCPIRLYVLLALALAPCRGCVLCTCPSIVASPEVWCVGTMGRWHPVACLVPTLSTHRGRRFRQPTKETAQPVTLSRRARPSTVTAFVALRRSRAVTDAAAGRRDAAMCVVAALIKRRGRPVTKTPTG
jgi:hypothetical protein